MASLAELWIYPVKGCRGIALDEARLEERGFMHDRRWMIVRGGEDKGAGRFLTQRELPRMARIETALEGTTLVLGIDQERFELPIANEGQPIETVVWGDTVRALAPSPAIDAALTHFLGRPVRLVRFPDAVRRDCDPDYAPSGAHTGFADGFPLLITNRGSLEALNAAIGDAGGTPVPMTRFRANIVLDGLEAGAEDHAGRMRLAGGPDLLIVKRCDRCAVTTVDQDQGEKAGAEPIRTLGRIRKNLRTGGFWFGQNAVPEAPGRVHVGQEVALEPG